MSDRSEKIPVIEIFGPTIQGEGRHIGSPTNFVRLGGCDYRCRACDSMHAVDGHEIEKRATIMSAQEIAASVIDLYKKTGVYDITISGGNPVLWDLSPFIEDMQAAGIVTHLETQGSIYKEWVSYVDFVTVSPKGPGMGYGQQGVINQVCNFLHDLEEGGGDIFNAQLKIPVFNEKDLEFARRVKDATSLWNLPLILSVGNDWGNAPEKPALVTMQHVLLERLAYITSIVLRDYQDLFYPRLQILPQLHVLCWGNELER